MSDRNILVTMECFIHKDGKYLMLHRRADKKIMPDVWMTPGGKRDFNEGLFAATRREIQEETGLKISDLRIRATGNAYLEDLDQEIYFHFVFAEYVSGELPANPEDGELVWLTPQEIQQLPTLLSELREIGLELFEKSDEVLSYSAVYSAGNTLRSFAKEQA